MGISNLADDAALVPEYAWRICNGFSKVPPIWLSGYVTGSVSPLPRTAGQKACVQRKRNLAHRNTGTLISLGTQL